MKGKVNKMNFNPSTVIKVDRTKEVDLSEYSSGVCLIETWCPDSIKLATIITTNNNKIQMIYLEGKKGHVFKNGVFQPTKIQYNIGDLDYEYVPVLFLEKDGKYYGPWTTHHGTEFKVKKERYVKL